MRNGLQNGMRNGLRNDLRIGLRNGLRNNLRNDLRNGLRNYKQNNIYGFYGSLTWIRHRAVRIIPLGHWRRHVRGIRCIGRRTVRYGHTLTVHRVRYILLGCRSSCGGCSRRRGTWWCVLLLFYSKTTRATCITDTYIPRLL